MKNSLLLLLLSALFVFEVSSQELKVIEIQPPEYTEVDDLVFLKEELQGKQLVMLGEYTHMYGNIFEMKARVVEFLHQELGFTTIAMESPVYDIWKMNKNGFNKKSFNESVFGLWSSSLEFQRLVNYVEKNNLKIIGVDSQIINTQEFIDDFFDYCEAQNIEIRLDVDDFGIVIETVLDDYVYYKDDIKYVAYHKELKRILSKIENLTDNEDNYYWKLIVEGLISNSKDAYSNKKEILSSDFANKDHNLRDAEMAKNLLRHMQISPDEKFVFWADNIHIVNNISSIKKPIIKDFVSAGTHLHNALKDKVYSLATLHANDSVLELNRWHKTPIQPNSFEDELNKLNKPFLFISTNQPAMKISKQTRLFHWTDYTQARLDQLYDGYIFIKEARLPKGEEIKVNRIAKSSEKVLHRAIESKKNSNSVYKGRVLNRKTKKPIAFTNLIIKEKGIYRVADKNGEFDLTIVKAIEPESKVIISSMGFATLIVPINELTEIIYLEQKDEILSEVVIRGRISPKTVLKETITKLSVNHPTSPFNYYAYQKALNIAEDSTYIDLELITKNYDQGYLSPYRSVPRVEQIKWNAGEDLNIYTNVMELSQLRQNPIRYSNILHKRKYKKFKLDFLEPKTQEEEDFYIIAFEVDKDKWNFTNRGYPTKYSGKIYIDKNTSAVVRVYENWEASLDNWEIKKYFTERKGYRRDNPILECSQLTFKEENVAYFSDVLGDKKYYATHFASSRYSEFIDNKNNKIHNLIGREFSIFKYDIEEVEEIEYEYHEHKKEATLLNRVNHDVGFWKDFYKQYNFE